MFLISLEKRKVFTAPPFIALLYMKKGDISCWQTIEDSLLKYVLLSGAEKEELEGQFP